MSYVTYKLIHFAGIFTLIAVLAATSMHAIRDGTRADNPYRRVLGAAQGIAAFLVILGGFGMLARLGFLREGLPGWVYLKLVLWLALVAALALPYRGRRHARALLVALPVLAVAGGATALLKPF